MRAWVEAGDQSQVQFSNRDIIPAEGMRWGMHIGQNIDFLAGDGVLLIFSCIFSRLIKYL